MTDDADQSKPWERNAGQFDRPTSVAPVAEDRPMAELPDPDAAFRYRGIEPIDVEEDEVEAVAAEEPAAPAPVSSSHWQLRLIVERIEAIDDRIREEREDRKEVRSEAKLNGWDLKALDEVLRRRRMDPDALDQLDGIVATYESALGMGRPGVIDGGELRADRPPVEGGIVRNNKVSQSLALIQGAKMAREA